jgi:undecaprenyl diphosphate synthase
MLIQRHSDGGETLPRHVAVVLGSEATATDVCNIYAWCDELGVETTTVCLPDAVDRESYRDAVADLDPPVSVSGEDPGSESQESRRYLSYVGGREEVVEAFRRIAEDIEDGRLEPDDVGAEDIERNLAVPEDPDLLIDASGEGLSDVLVWQTVYSELSYVDELDKDAIIDCIEDYEERERRYGR